MQQPAMEMNEVVFSDTLELDIVYELKLERLTATDVAMIGLLAH